LSLTPLRASFKRLLTLTVLFLLIEFFDELHYGIQSAALPSMRVDLGLTYAQIGLLLGLPGLLSSFIEPVMFLLGDILARKRLVIGGGLAIALALALTATAQSYPAMLLAFMIAYPASGAFVSLSQATLIDLHPGREPHMMARWTVFGSAGNLLGPALLAGLFALGLSWRIPYIGLLVLALTLLWGLARRSFPPRHAALGEHAPSLKETPRWMLANLMEAFHNRTLMRWVGLLPLSDLMLDILTGYSALYLADVAGLTPAQTGLALTLLMAASLGADLLLIPLLERVPGRSVVRISAILSIFIYSAFLLAPGTAIKIILLAGVRISTIGWYAVLKGEAYAAAPGRSGTVEAVNSLVGVIAGVLTALVGWTASQAGLPAAMWLLLAGPLALILFVPRETQNT
jgi:MFS transporter, FSR family, fosmidomycin resistance protein